jgi:hypothetical protein
MINLSSNQRFSIDNTKQLRHIAHALPEREFRPLRDVSYSLRFLGLLNAEKPTCRYSQQMVFINCETGGYIWIDPLRAYRFRGDPKHLNWVNVIADRFCDNKIAPGTSLSISVGGICVVFGGRFSHESEI